MAMKKKPVTGMKDITPRRDGDPRLRDPYDQRYLSERLDFTSIETPCVEHIAEPLQQAGRRKRKTDF